MELSSSLEFDFSIYRLFLIAVASVVCGILGALLRWTHWGAVIRATAEDPEMSELLKVDTRRISMLVFSAGSALAGMGGVLAAPLFSVHPSMGEEIIAIAFLIVTVGGMGVLTGTIVSAFVFGQISSVGVLAVGAYADVLALISMGALLLVRPKGLFARVRDR